MIYVVTGFMRSGTSMLMQACEAGGMAVVKSETRDEVNRIHSDAWYQPNPVSLYETPVLEMQVSGWPRGHDGCVVKVVAPWLQHLAVHDYRVVVMRRDPEEIRQSYEAAFHAKVTVDQIEQVMKHLLEQLSNRRDIRDVHELAYTDVIAHPSLALSQLHWPFDLDGAAAVIDATRYRFRGDRLVVGL